GGEVRGVAREGGRATLQGRARGGGDAGGHGLPARRPADQAGDGGRGAAPHPHPRRGVRTGRGGDMTEQKIERSDVLNFFEYEKVRAAMRARIIELKRVRRVTVGKHLS